MNKSTKEKLLEVLRIEFGAADLPFPEDAARKLAGQPAGPSQEELMKAGMVLDLYGRIERQLDEAPEPDPRELERTLDRLRGELRYELRSVLLKIGKKMPHRPGGRHKKLSAEKERKAVRLVGTLMGSGQSYPEALANVAKRFSVSSKTIQRAWQKLHRERKHRP